LVELIEYVMVFGISAGVAGASIVVVEGAIPGLGSLASASVSDQIAGAARLSIVQGTNATLLLPLREESISCDAGSLVVGGSGGSRSYLVGYPCSFYLAGLTGTCTLRFSSSRSALDLQAAC
jgi:hypothetical protein